MKIAILDSYYPEVIKAIPFDPSCSYESQLAAVLGRQFGTAAFYSNNLRALGHECIDIITNHPGLMSMRSLESQLSEFQPDVVFLQDLSIEFNYKPALVAAQFSCPWAGDRNVQKAQIAFTSFPHYVPRIEALGVKAVYLPLAFEPSILDYEQIDVRDVDDVGPRFINGSVIERKRDIDISFVGGVGRSLHWQQGTDVLEAVAAAFPERFQWWGYGLDRLSADSPLRRCYKGEAWGRAMFDIYRRSKIVVNRHGEVAEGFANNMRMYEATGCGALLLTDNQTDLFEEGNEILTYRSTDDAVQKLRQFADRPPEYSLGRDIAHFGQQRTLRDHTYAQRMKTISEVLTGMLCPA